MENRKIIPSSNGVPPGKTLAWAKNQNGEVIYGFVLYDTLAEALGDAGSLLMSSNAHSVSINSKEEDESYLHIYELKKIGSFPKQNPINWSQFNPLKWFK